MTLELLHPINPAKTRVLYLARHAPDDLPGLPAPVAAAPLPGYDVYQRNVLADLRGVGFNVVSSANPFAVTACAGQTDLVFSLLNRMPLRNPELLVPGLCAAAGIPCMGAPPNVRAAAEDKYLSKQLFGSLGLPVPPGWTCRRGVPLEPPPFSGPYFVKDRFGAASEGVGPDSLQDDWAGAARVVARLQDEGREVLVERYCPGIDVTASVLAGVKGAPYAVLGFVAPQSDRPGGVLTADLKIDDRLGNRLMEPEPDFAAAMHQDIAVIWRALGPIDYFRVDYRWNPETGGRRILEINICCYLGRGGAVCMTAAQHGFSRPDLLGHIVGHALGRRDVFP